MSPRGHCRLEVLMTSRMGSMPSKRGMRSTRGLSIMRSMSGKRILRSFPASSLSGMDNVHNERNYAMRATKKRRQDRFDPLVLRRLHASVPRVSDECH